MKLMLEESKAATTMKKQSQSPDVPRIKGGSASRFLSYVSLYSCYCKGPHEQAFYSLHLKTLHEYRGLDTEREFVNHMPWIIQLDQMKKSKEDCLSLMLGIWISLLLKKKNRWWL